MKSKITFLLASFLMLVFGTGPSYAKVGDVLKSLDQISNTKYYTITAPRGALTLNSQSNGVVSSKKSNGTVDNTAASTAENADKWAILSHDGVSYYLYNVENKSVLNSDGSMSKNLSEPLELMMATNPTGNYVFKIKKGTNTLNNNNSGGFALDAWSNEDGGNRLTIVEAGDFDASILDNLSTITFNVVDDASNIMATEVIKNCIKGVTYTPNVASRKGVKLTTSTVVADGTDKTVSSIFTFDETTFPFKLSESATENASWYMIKINRQTPKYCTFDGTNIKTSTTLTETSFSKETAFCFVGTPFGFKIVNAKTKSQAFGPSKVTTNAWLANGSVADAATFVFENSSENGYQSFQLLRNVNDPLGYLNDMNGALGYWVSTANRHDLGSNFSFIEVPSEYIDEITDFIVDNIKYNINADKESVTVTYPTEAEPTAAAPNTYTGDIVIPDEVTFGGKTYKVTAIGRAAFNRSTITSLVIGENVTETGYDCCAYTSTLKSVTIGSKVTKMNQGFAYACSNMKTIIAKPSTPPAAGPYIFSGSPVATVKISSLEAYKTAAQWSGLKYQASADFDFTYEELQTVINSNKDKVSGGTEPGYYTEASVEAISNAVAEAEKVSQDAETSTINAAVKGIADALNNIEIVQIEDGKCYYVVTAGNGNGYSGGPYNYENKNAVYSSNGYIMWKAWDKTDASQMYKFTAAPNGKWYMQNLADQSYFNKGQGSYGCKVTTSATPETGQIFTTVGSGNGKFAFTWANNVYAMAASHNGSDATGGYLNVWGNTAEATTYGVNQWYLHEVDPSVVEGIEAKNSLVAYYNEVSEAYTKMTDPTYDDAALTSEQLAALEAVLNECKDAIDKSSTTETYNSLLAKLKETYDKSPFIEGGRKSATMSVADIKDGSKIILEVGHTTYQGKYMVAYPNNNNGNSVMCNDDKSLATVWQLEATGRNDSIYTSKPTYYMKDLASGKYYGTTNSASVSPNDQRMVEDKANAIAFSFLTKDEIKDKENVDLNLYGVENPVFVQHSNADGTWFRLARFGSYSNVYAISSAFYPDNKDWQTWNLHSGNSNYTISDELADVLEEYGDITFPNVGTDPGCFDSTAVQPFVKALADAKALTSANTRKEYRDAIDNIKSAYQATQTATVNPIVDGYYYIESAWSSKAGQNIVAYDPNDGSGYLGNHAKANNAYDIFKLTTLADGQYSLQNLGSGRYVGQAVDANRVTLVDNTSDDVYQTFTYDAKGEFKWADNKTTFTYYIFEGWIGRYYKQLTSGFDAWYLRTVPQAVLDELNTPVNYYEIATESSEPVEGKTYVIKSVNKGLYATATGASKEISALNNEAIWSIENTGTHTGDGGDISMGDDSDDQLVKYYLKSVNKDGFWQAEDFTDGATEGSPWDGYDTHKYAGLNAYFGDYENAQEFTILKATEFSEDQTRSSVGKDQTPKGYVIATVEKVTSGNFSKYYKLDTQGGDVALDPYVADVDWEFFEATKGTDINKELEIALKEYNFDTTNAPTGNDPGFYNADNFAAYTAALTAAKAINENSDKSDIRKAIDDLAAAYAKVNEINPITEGYYAIVSAGKGSGYPFSDEEKYDDEDRFALYNDGGIVKWKTYDESVAEEVYYLSPSTDGNWNVKSLADNSYINKGAGSYNCNVLTSNEPQTAQKFTLSVVPGKFIVNSTAGNFAYALTNSHNGAGDKTEGNLNIWGSANEANSGKMNLWFLRKVSDENVSKAKEAIASGLSDLIAKYKSTEIPTGENPGMTPASAVEEFATAIAKAEDVATNGSVDEKIAATYALKTAYVTCINTVNPIVDGGIYYIINDNAKIQAAGKPEKAMYIDATAKTVRWAVKVDHDPTFAFKVSVNSDGTYSLQNVKTGLYTGSATAFCGVVPSSETAVPLTMYNYAGTGSYYIKGEKQSNGMAWTYCPQGNPAGTADGPANVWAYNGEGTASGNVAHAEWTWRLVPYTEATGGVWEIASEPSAPESGKTYVIKNASENIYAVSQGASKTINPFDNSAIWGVEATGNTVDEDVPTYYLKSEAKGGYWQSEDFTAGADENSPWDGFDTHKYAGLNANFGAIDNAQAFTLLESTAFGTEQTRSSIGKGKSPQGYSITTADKVTMGTFSKFYKLDTQRGTDIALDPYDTGALDWLFYEATFNNSLDAELAAALKAYDFNTEGVATGTEPGYYNADNFAAYNSALATAKALTSESSALDKRNAIDALAAAYKLATTVNPIVEGYYTIVSAGKGSGYPFSDEEKYDDEDRFALYNSNGIVSWKTYDESAYDEIYYLSPSADGSWYAKSLIDNTYMNRGTGSYNCQVTTSAEAVTSQEFVLSDVVGKFIAKFNGNPYVYALTPSHNGSRGNATGNLNIWGAAGEANKGKMNLWYLHKVSDETVVKAKESIVAGLDDLIAEIEGKNLEGSELPGYYSKANVDSLTKSLTEAKNLGESTVDEKLSTIEALKTIYNKTLTELNPITEGYYYLVSKYQAYKDKFGSPAGMYIASGETLESGKSPVRYEIFDESNANFIFKLTPKDGVADGFYAQSAYAGKYLNTGDGTNWYGEITIASDNADNAQLFKNYGLGQYWVADETDTRVSRCVRKNGTNNGTIYGWTQIGDVVSEADAGYNAWELIPVSADKVAMLITAQEAKDQAANSKYNELCDYVNGIQPTYDSYVDDASELSEEIKNALKQGYQKFTDARNAYPYDITSTAEDYERIKQNLEELMATAKKEISGVDGIATGGNSTINATNGGLTVTAEADMTLSIYNASGVLVTKQSLKAGETTSVSLAPGVYVVNGKKILVK